MGERGDAEGGGGGLKVEAAEFDIVGVRVYVVKVEYSGPLRPDDLLGRAPRGVVLAVMDTSSVNVCEAVLALLYIIEDSVLGIRRIRDDNIALLAYLTRSKQVRRALEAAGGHRGLVAVSFDRKALSSLVASLTGAPPTWVRGSCDGDRLASLAEFRLTDVLGK